MTLRTWERVFELYEGTPDEEQLAALLFQVLHVINNNQPDAAVDRIRAMFDDRAMSITENLE